MAERKDKDQERSSSARGGDGGRTGRTEKGRDEGSVAVGRRRTSPSGAGRSGFTSPFGLMHELSDEMSRMFNSFGLSREPGRSGFGTMWTPQVDVLRRGDDLIVRADLPGLSKDDVSVDVEENVLTIRGERHEEKEEEREGYYWHERNEGSFMRSIPLPEGADAERASARFDNGVLEVRVPAPEREDTSRGRRIEIR